jgi:hypothetical protein
MHIQSIRSFGSTAGRDARVATSYVVIMLYTAQCLRNIYMEDVSGFRSTAVFKCCVAIILTTAGFMLIYFLCMLILVASVLN